MICRKCGFQNNKGAAFCGGCGAKLETAGSGGKKSNVPVLIGVGLALAAGLIVGILLSGGKDTTAEKRVSSTSTTQPATTAPAATTPATTAPAATTPATTEPATTVPETTAPATTAPKKVLSCKAGDTISFGYYPQSKNGNDSTLIEWKVLEVSGHYALLLSKYGLDTIPYNKNYESVTWENSSIRKWLNSTFLNTAFSSGAQNWICQTQVDNSPSQGFNLWDTTGGNTTYDYIFLLSYAEASKYFDITGPGTVGPEEARVTPTAYAVEQGAYESDKYFAQSGSAYTRWWLRSPGINQYDAACVHSSGCVGEQKSTTQDTTVRPAMWINLEQD